MTTDKAIQELRTIANEYLTRARVPYSGKPAAAALLLSDGFVVPGVRVESASFSLTVPAALNAITTAVAAGRRDIVALVISGPVPATSDALCLGFELSRAPADGPESRPSVWCHPRTDLPSPVGIFSPFLDGDWSSPESAVRLAHGIADRALIPESHFPVGCVLLCEDGRILPGVNVEHPDWTCILCAERNALSTAVTYGVGAVSQVALSCPTDPGGSPCGACRQLLVELASGADIWMDRGQSSPIRTNPSQLLPFAFSGSSLSARDDQ